MELPLYQQLARHMAQAIEAGTLRQGDRLPSVRQMVQQHQVSVSTALQVYRELENLRLIEARPKSGYFVARQVVAKIAKAVPVEFSQADLAVTERRVYEYFRIARNQCKVRLDVAIGDAALYPTKKLQLLGSQLLRRYPKLLTQYPSSAGLPALKAEIVRHMLAAGCTLAPEDIVLTHGGTEALNLAIRSVAEPGDTIAVESPVYFGILQILKSLGMQVLEIPTHAATGMSLDALDIATRSKGAVKAVISITNFQNPLGCTMSDDNKQRMVQLLAEREIPLIEDDIYGELHFGKRRPFAAKAWDRTGNVLLCSSASKVAAPGLRIGWIAPGRWYSKVDVMKLTSSMSCANFNQTLLAEFMAHGAYDHHLRKLRQTFRSQTRQMLQAVRHYFPVGTQVEMPAGGFLLWVQLPKQVDSWQVFVKAYEQGIGIVPGCLFSTTHHFDHCIRLSAGYPWTEELEQAVAKLGQIIALSL